MAHMSMPETQALFASLGFATPAYDILRPPSNPNVVAFQRKIKSAAVGATVVGYSVLAARIAYRP